MPNVANTNMTQAKEAYVTLLDMSRLLDTELDQETLTICVRLCEAGVNPQSLANVLQVLRTEVKKAKNPVEHNNDNNI